MAKRVSVVSIKYSNENINRNVCIFKLDYILAKATVVHEYFKEVNVRNAI